MITYTTVYFTCTKINSITYSFVPYLKKYLFERESDEEEVGMGEEERGKERDPQKHKMSKYRKVTCSLSACL